MDHYTLADGTPLQPGIAFEANGLAYQANFLLLATDDDLAAHGITKTTVADPEPSADDIKAGLATYANRRHEVLLNGGVTVNGIAITTNTNGRVNLSGAVSLAQLQPEMSFNWVLDTGPVALTAADIIAMGQTVGIWVQATYSALSAVLAAIHAGTITTTAEIDAADWPSATITTG